MSYRRPDTSKAVVRDSIVSNDTEPNRDENSVSVIKNSAWKHDRLRITVMVEAVLHSPYQSHVNTPQRPFDEHASQCRLD